MTIDYDALVESLEKRALVMTDDPVYRRALDAIAALRKRLDEAMGRNIVVKAERDALRAEVEALRKDAERYRWLRDGEWSRAHTPALWDSLVHAQSELLDARIDAVMISSSTTKGE